MDNIPIENIYYLILYAFGAVKNKDSLKTKDLEDNSSFDEVIIKIFISEVEKIIKQGIYHDYTLIEEETMYIKGRINIKESLINLNKKNICSFDEYNNCQISNKIIKYTLNKLLFANSLDNNLKKRIRNNYFYFESVPLEYFNLKDIKNIQLNRLNKYYEIALKFALFLNHSLIPKDAVGNFDFIHIFKDDELMSKIYEQFLYNFYNVNLEKDYKVKSGSRFEWELNRVDASQSNLPLMETDIEIYNNDSLIVMDAKYYTNAFSNRNGIEKFISGHLYQMSAYLNYYEGKYKNIRGILIYPSNNYSFYERYKKENSYFLEFSTVNLAQDWNFIEKELLSLI